MNPNGAGAVCEAVVSRFDPGLPPQSPITSTRLPSPPGSGIILPMATSSDRDPHRYSDDDIEVEAERALDKIYDHELSGTSVSREATIKFLSTIARSCQATINSVNDDIRSGH